MLSAPTGRCECAFRPIIATSHGWQSRQDTMWSSCTLARQCSTAPRFCAVENEPDSLIGPNVGESGLYLLATSVPSRDNEDDIAYLAGKRRCITHLEQCGSIDDDPF